MIADYMTLFQEDVSLPEMFYTSSFYFESSSRKWPGALRVLTRLSVSALYNAFPFFRQT